MDKGEIAEHVTPAMVRTAALRASHMADSVKWNLDVAIFLFAVIIVVTILSSQDAPLEVLAPVAVVGLAAAWLIGWRKGKKLYRRLYDEELSRLAHESAKEAAVRSQTKVLADAVQKALRDRLT